MNFILNRIHVVKYMVIILLILFMSPRETSLLFLLFIYTLEFKLFRYLLLAADVKMYKTVQSMTDESCNLTWIHFSIGVYKMAWSLKYINVQLSHFRMQNKILHLTIIYQTNQPNA